MNIKNTLSLTLSEAVELLSKIADSLEQKKEFAFDLKGQEVSVEVGSNMMAQMSISPDEFSIVFNWEMGTEDREENWRATFDDGIQGGLAVSEEYHEPPKMVREVNIPEQRTSQPQIPFETPVQTVRRALPDRMALNTSTLPLEGGYWTSAFTSNGDNQWSPVEVTSELENKKWEGDDQITSLKDITPRVPGSSGTAKKEEDDLFSELDDLGKKKQRSSRTPSVEKVSIPESNLRPAGGILAPSTTTQSWQEPKPEENATSDDWVKPSQFLNREQEGRMTTGVSKRQNIPVPSDETRGGSDVEWKEPTAEENVTDDDWVKPSEFLKRKTEGSDVASRPPPEAPDAKDKDKKKKGWANW